MCRHSGRTTANWSTLKRARQICNQEKRINQLFPTQPAYRKAMRKTYCTVDASHADNAQLAFDFAALGHPPPFALDSRDRQRLGELGGSGTAGHCLTEYVR